MGWVDRSNLEQLIVWDMDDEDALERDSKDVLEVGYPIARNRKSAEPGIEVVVLLS